MCTITLYQGEKMMKKLRALILSVFITVSFLSATVVAAGNLSIVSTATGEDNVSVFVRGADASAEVSAQVGTSEAASVSASKIGDLDIPMRTLVMIDNSKSIKKADHAKISAILQDMISDKKDSEEIAISTYSEEISYLCDYTADYTTLKTAIDSLEYNDQETFLTDILCDIIPSDFAGEDGVFRRIVIISDGVDNKPRGKTRDDLNRVMAEYVFPIYSIGCSTANNNDELANLFSISNQSNAVTFLLDDYENVIDITSELRGDRDIVKYTIVPAAEQLDGTSKAVKLTIGSESISADVRVPHVVMTEPEPTVIETEEPTVEEPSTEPEPEEPGIPWMLIIIVAGSVLAVVLIVIIVVAVVINNKKKNQFVPINDEFVNDYDNRDAIPASPTELIYNRPVGDDNSTVMMWNNAETYHINLTDISSPAKSLQIPLTGTVTIGRKPGCDAVFDYDKSVSGRHCEISVRGGHFFLKDLQSSNGTYVNGSKILTEAEIFSGNVIKLGRLEVRFEVR